MACPTSEPGPVTRLSAPGGSPARSSASHSAQAEPGAISAGFSTTALPKASAGATFQAGMAMGKFQGVIAPTTPSGSRVTSTQVPGRAPGNASPASRTASPAKKCRTCAARATSASASASGLPSSRASRCPSSPRRPSISFAAARSTSPRRAGTSRDHASNAARAASTAIAAWPRSPWAWRSTTSERSEGLTSGAHPAVSTRRPPISRGFTDPAPQRASSIIAR